MYEDHTESGEPDNFRYASYDDHTMHHTTQHTMHHTRQHTMHHTTQHTMHHTTQHMAQHAMRRTTLHTTNHTTKHDTSMMHHTTQHPILSSATLPFATRKENRFSNEKKRKKNKIFFFFWLIPPSTAWRWDSSTSGSVYPLIFIYCILFPTPQPPGNSVSLGDATSSKAFQRTMSTH